VEDLGHVLLADLDVDRIHDHAGAQRAPEDDQRLDPVVGEQRDSIAGVDAFARQEAGEAPRQRLELTEGDPGALVGTLDEDLVRTAAGVLLEQRIGVGVCARAPGIQREGYCARGGADVKPPSPPRRPREMADGRGAQRSALL